jgi:hypothetical protein
VRRLLFLCVSLVVAAGCGGAKKSAPQKTTQTTPQTTESSSRTDCDRKGITTQAAREGVCVVKSTTITVADNAHWLHMNDYDARVTGVRAAATVGTLSADTFQSGGAFVIVTLRVKNTGTVPRAFDRTSKLVFLLVDQKQYGEIPPAELAAPDSFRSHDGAIEPGQVETGTIVFGLPLVHAQSVRARGSDLVFLNFDEAGTGFPLVGRTAAIGFIRLWQ